MQSIDTVVGKLFNDKNPFYIPKYQRAYDWDDENIEEFVNDLNEMLRLRELNQQREHFFGGIVTIGFPDIRSPHGIRYEVVDGQQRLTTFTIALKSIADHYFDIADISEKRGDNDSKDLATALGDEILDSYIYYKHTIEGKLVRRQRLTLSRTDREYFESLISARNSACPDPVEPSHIKLREARRKLVKSLLPPLPKKSDPIPAVIQRLELLKSALLQDCSLIHLTASRAEEAFNLFRVLNYRGKNISDFDLIRSNLLETLIEHEDLQEQAESELEDIRKCPPETCDDFLSHYFSSKKGVRPRKKYVYQDYMDRLFKEEGIIKDRTRAEAALSDLREMRKNFTWYRALTIGEWPYGSISSPYAWEKQRLSLLMRMLSHTLCLPYLLAARDRLDEKDFSAIPFLLERFFVRFKKVCSGSANKLQKIYEKNAEALRAATDPNSSVLQSALLELQADCSDALFRPSLNEKFKYVENGSNMELRYLLGTLEALWGWAKSGCEGVPKDKTKIINFEAIHVEHIYPQSAQGAYVRLNLEEHKHKIGNLTLLAGDENVDCSNKPYEEKRGRYERSAIVMTRDLADLQEWNISEFNKRHEELGKLSERLFRIGQT